MISDEILQALSPLERAELLRRLHALTAAQVKPSQRVVTARRWFLRLLAGCCLILVPWTVGLAVSLPRHYVAANWRLAWTSFDIVLLCCLALTAWSLWRQRQIAVPAAMITSVLLVGDAWFDLLTADGRHDLITSAASALFAELPLAVLLGTLSVRLLHASTRVARGLMPDAPLRPLWRTPLLSYPQPVVARTWRSPSRP